MTTARLSDTAESLSTVLVLHQQADLWAEIFGYVDCTNEWQKLNWSLVHWQWIDKLTP